jgi:hypothetical protein
MPKAPCAADVNIFSFGNALSRRRYVLKSHFPQTVSGHKITITTK